MTFRASGRSARAPWLLLFIAVCLVAANLRITITGVGPLLETIADDLGVATASLGALASLPLLVWGAISPLSHSIGAKLGTTRAVSLSLVILAVGTVWRSLPGWGANLWIGTLLTGVGLAISNVIMPAVIKRDFGARVPLVMGAYTALLGGMGAVSAGLVVPLSQVGPAGATLGWRGALLCTGALLPVALVAWIVANRRGADSVQVADPAPQEPAPQERAAQRPAPSSAGRRIWQDRTAWLVAIHMGSQSAVFYTLTAWLAPYGIAIGRSPVTAGFDVMTFQLCGIAGSALFPLVARGRANTAAPVFIPVMALVSTVGILTLPALYPVWLVLGGLATGSSLTLALTLVALRARTDEHASALSGMAQSVGYIVAAIGPTLFGVLLGFTGNWVLPFALIILACLSQATAGALLRRPRFVLE